MRDPELVFKAQLAASALERAWQRWRVVHGLVADPMPAISSYVGYSLEEPWGQPRVVFGLSADDAEQLAALLDRHDCIGPVHAMVAARPADRELPAGAAARTGLPLPVPPQAPSVVAEQSGPPRSSPEREADRPRKAADDRDGPVFRQVSAAAREAAAVRASEKPGTRPGREAGAARGSEQPGTRPGREAADQTAGEIASAPAISGRSAAPGAVTQLGAAGPENPADPETMIAREPVVAAADAVGPESTVAPVSMAAADSATVPEGTTVPESTTERASAAAQDDAVGSDGAGGTAAASDAETVRPDSAAGDGDSRADVAGQAADGPGPLALAASAAREAAEARIKAALHLTRHSGLEPPYPLENPYPSETFDVTGLIPPPAAGGTDGPAGAPGVTVVPGPLRRPEVASGAQPWPAQDRREQDRRDDGSPLQQGDVASTWGGSDLGDSDDEQPPVVPFKPRPDLAAYLDEGPEPDPDYDERPDHTSAGYAKRNRITRGYSIPRLSRSKRPGAVPGA